VMLVMLPACAGVRDALIDSLFTTGIGVR